MTPAADCPPAVRATRIGGHPSNCHCDGCTPLMARYQKQRRLKQYRGTWETLVEAEPSIALLREYIAAGWTEWQIGYVARLTPRYIGRLLNPQEGRAATVRMQPGTAAAIRSLTHADRFDAAVPDETYLNRVGSVRRLQAMACNNWSQRNLSARYGPTVVRFMERGVITARAARTLRNAYEELWNVPGPSPTAAAWARRNGFAPAAAWEHLDIDDPRVMPDFGVSVDPTEALVENAEWLHAEFDMTWEAVAAQLGVPVGTLHTYRGRIQKRAEAAAGGAA